MRLCIENCRSGKVTSYSSGSRSTRIGTRGSTTPWSDCSLSTMSRCVLCRSKFRFPVHRAHAATKTHKSVTIYVLAGNSVRWHQDNAAQTLRGPGKGKIQFCGTNQYGIVVSQR